MGLFDEGGKGNAVYDSCVQLAKTQPKLRPNLCFDWSPRASEEKKSDAKIHAYDASPR